MQIIQVPNFMFLKLESIKYRFYLCIKMLIGKFFVELMSRQAQKTILVSISLEVEIYADFSLILPDLN